MNSFTFNGKSSADFGLIIDSKEIYSSPKRDMSLVSVSGRNGDVIIDNNRYTNVTVSYTVGIKNIKDNIKMLKAWLLTPGYFVLSDTYNPEYFRFACFNSSLDVTELLKNIGKAVISFTCKPFMYSYEGQNAITVTNDTVISNPEPFASQPLLKVYGNGSITFFINNHSYLIENVNSFVYVDCELMTAYKDTTLMNKNIKFTEFPILEVGDNAIALGNNCTSIEITPRWCTL
ncbi:MAG: hypothetical protein Q4C99_00390 [Clostridia bacterium]|nr:hypothetical protein [Clostridia bacterium]